jgi:hypothetical protein
MALGLETNLEYTKSVQLVARGKSWPFPLYGWSEDLSDRKEMCDL